MARVWADSQHGGSELLMLLAISDFADDEGNAYPAVSTLAKKCRLGDRYANVLLQKLKASGELEIRLNEGPKGTNRYRVTVGLGVKHSSPLNQSSSLNQASSGGEPEFLKPLNQSSPEPSLNHQEPPKGGKPRAKKVTFRTWYGQAKELSEKVLADDDPVYAYCESIGLDRGFFEIAWFSFKTEHWDSQKLQASWPQTLRNYIAKNYGGLRYLKDGAWRLTVAGKQVALSNDMDPEMVCFPKQRQESFV